MRPSPTAPSLTLVVVTLFWLWTLDWSPLAPMVARAEDPVAVVTTIVQVVGCGLAGWGTALALGYGGLPAVYIGAAVAFSSTMIVVKLLAAASTIGTGGSAGDFAPSLVLGALLIVGLFTRISAFILSGLMACAYFIGHMFKDPANPVFHPLLNGGTLAILFCFACLYLSTAGGGPFSLDATMRKKQ